MGEKFFKNPFIDYSEESTKDVIENHSVSPKNRVSKCLDAKWRGTLDQFQHLDYTDYTVYTGTSGIALLKLKKDPDNKENLQEVKKLLSLDRLHNKRCSFLCGDAGPLSIGIVVNHKLGNHAEVKNLVQKLKLLGKHVLQANSDVPNEYLYGRAGYLYGLLYAQKNVSPPPFDESFISSVVKVILLCGKNLAKAENFKCPLMYQWHESYYLGAAHGLSGILYLLLQVKEYLTTEELKNLIKPTIDYLITQRLHTGNFPSRLGGDADKHVQWCHGAPGFVYLYTTAYKVFHDPVYLDIARSCGNVIWERGLLKKGYSICHGVSGNGYCFLELYQTTKEEMYLYRAIKFAEWCMDYKKEHEQKYPDRPLSLFEGIAGPMYFLLDIQKPMEAKFPGFTL